MKKKIISLVVLTSFALSMSGCGKNMGGLFDKSKDNSSGVTEDNGTDNNDKSSSSDSDSKKTKKSLFGSNTDSTDILKDPDVTKKINVINTYIDKLYYFDIDKDKQEEAVLDGIMAGLDDPYSVYYTQDEFSSLQEESSGEYVGIGAVVTQDADKVISIVRPIKNGPAEKAGLLAEDVIVEVDGESTAGQDLSLVVDKMRGVEGTTAHVKIYRPSESKYIDLDIERRVVENYSVSNSMINNDIGYVQIEQFYENTGNEFVAAMEECQKQGAKGIVIDLRDNPGGLLNVVVDMCDYILEDITVVSTKDKDGNVLSEYKAKDGKTLDIPLVVLVNGNSASASEIFTGAMKDTGKAKIVGTTTYGKGIVQSVIPLEDGSAIKLTVAKYFTPNGNDIHKIGVEPDYVVELKDGKTSAVNIKREDDVQLDKAIEVMNGMIK